MQNPNISNAGHLTNRSQASLLDARSLSPSIHMMHSFHEGYPAELPAQQFYHSMPHKSSMSNVHDHIPPHNRTMSSIINRTFAPTVNPQMQLQSSTATTTLPRNHPVNEFTEQYNRLQQARMEQQMKTHNEAMMRKQQTFAMRQMMNPPPMSRQVSAINIHQQVNTSTQTTPNTQHPQSIQGQMPLNNPFGMEHFHSHHNTASPKHFNHIEKPNHLQLQQEHQQLMQSLRNDFEIKIQQQKNQNSQRQSTNPFMQSSDIDSDARGDSGAQSPVHQSIERYRDIPSSSSATSTPTKLLKSPKTKRQPTSLVTFSGWLYKLSSEGLRTWRRRWFVLSDYCLFYYKGPEEDKLLGSILLPSYLLSECMPSEIKAYRKYSFKLEHKNMRTYYLASENGDYMRKWMRVIRAATLMQSFSEAQNRKMLATSIPISTNSYEYGTGTGTNKYDQYRNDSNQRKVDIHPTLNPFLIFDEDNERQPLYVNAPPKPRRTHEMELTMFGNDPSMFPLSSEASTESTPKALPLRMLEYEDLYNEQERQISNNPIKYSENPGQPTADIQNYGLENVAAPYNNEFGGSIGKKPYQQKKMPPRPRSADFLEYESKRQFRRFKEFDSTGHFGERLPSRPKSSLDINSAMDNYYYSEASYAAKMRQSAQYLQNRHMMSMGREDTRLSTLRYEKERKRLTTEFHNYTANLILNNGLTLPRSKYMSTNDPFHISSLMRSSEPTESTFNADRYLMKNSESNLTEHYRSNDMINGKASSMSTRDDLQNSTANIWQPDISAGTLLSKTHEELVLLLIQLRRQVDIKERGISRRLKDMQTIQRRLKNEEATATRLELMGRLEVLREEVNKMEQQYEKTKPLMNLVDNMVKLGSLYRAGSMQWDTNSMGSGMNLQRLRVNQKELERRLQLDDQKQWNKFDPNQIELQNKVQQLYELDQRLQEESNNLQMLQQDKDDIENALEELNQRFATNEMLPETYMTTKKIQHSLELELSKVHNQLAENSRRLEETVAGNTKLERELLVLRQKLQATRDKSAGHLSYMSVMGNSRTADAFETELRKVRDSVGDTKRQREELSMAVNQLTLDSNAERVKTSSNDMLLKMNANKRIDSDWTETDLDSMHKKNSLNANGNLSGSSTFDQTYRNENEPYYYQYQQNADDLNPDEHWLGNDKQEIKTVRIVKRESERRHKDKLNQNYDTNAISNEHNNPEQLNEFLSTYQSEPRSNNYYDDEPSASKAKTTIRNAPHSMANTNSTGRNDNIFQSNNARETHTDRGKLPAKHEQTTTKVANASAAASNNQSSQYKRFTPRKKKRHNTAPTSENFMDYMAERDSYKYNNHRARDDLDMEVVLRSNPPVENTISGPPDVIRSALGQNSEYLFEKMN